MIKKLSLWSFSICFTLISVWKIHDWMVDNFSIHRLKFAANYLEKPSKDEESDYFFLKEITSSPLSYLSSGSQSFAFITSDGTYVVKFFKSSSSSNKLPQPIGEIQTSLFDSLVICSTHFPKETALLLIHLNRSNPSMPVILYDRIGIKHKVDISNLQFIVQKKVIVASDYFTVLRNQKNLTKAQRSLDTLISFIQKRNSYGYIDKDPNLFCNFGFLEDEVIQLDVGGFIHNPTYATAYFQKNELPKINKRCGTWIKKFYPELLPYFESKIKSLIDPIVE